MIDGNSNNWHSNPAQAASATLKTAASFWYLVALIGMWIFAYYIVAYFGGVVALEGIEGFKNTHLPNGYIPGDNLHNISLAGHIFLAVYIVGFGPLQLVPQIRSHFPALHRWNGRLYIPIVIMTSIAGIYMIWSRGTAIKLLHLGNTIDAVLIIIFASLTLRFALARKFDKHRRWALRAFMAVSAVWFYRVALMGWTFLTGGIGIDYETFSGPFLAFLAFGQFLFPLAVLELYLFTQDRASTVGRFAMAGGLFILTILMGVGIFEATMNMWLPKL